MTRDRNGNIQRAEPGRAPSDLKREQTPNDLRCKQLHGIVLIDSELSKNAFCSIRCEGCGTINFYNCTLSGNYNSQGYAGFHSCHSEFVPVCILVLG